MPSRPRIGIPTGRGWSRKQILGHLIDSALNNHQRFVLASLDSSYDGPSYPQEGWVVIHGYQSMEWNILLGHWRYQNELLAGVVERIPESSLGARTMIPRLGFLIEDYLVHLRHHVKQIAQ